MKKAERVQFILDTLEQYYPETPIPLNHTDPYTLLVSVLLSAQCTDERVNQITPHLFAKANNPADMLKLSVEEIQQIIRPCGLSPMKSKGIYGLSQMIMDLHNGEVPQSFEALEAMPAVGHKTASVVMSQAFGVPAFPVDTHIHRLAYRWRLVQPKAWKKLSVISNASFQKSAGTKPTFKLFLWVENFVLLADISLKNAQYAQCLDAGKKPNNYEQMALII